MSDRMRLTGMYSGMDTESIVQELVKVRETKVTKLKGDQKKHEWKQTAWQDLNSKIYNLYSNTLSNLRLTGAYKKKNTTCSDITKAKIVSNDNAMNGTQTLKINQLAKAGYLTGAKISKANGEKLKTTDTLSTIDSSLVGQKITISVGQGDEAKTTEIEITSDMTMNNLANKFAEAGVNASFDETNQRFFISAKDTGLVNEFKLSADGNTLGMLGLDNSEYLTGKSISQTDADGKTVNFNKNSKLSVIDPNLVGTNIVFEKGDKSETLSITADSTVEDLLEAADKAGIKATFDEKTQQFKFQSDGSASGFVIKEKNGNNGKLAKLGLDATTTQKGSECTRIDAQDSEIVLNGATFTSNSNSFSINGLTISTLGVTDEEISIVTTTDFDGIYNTVKDFLTEYNELMKEMDKLYNADSARKYDMLTSEQKEAMTDDEVEEWENKIKSSLLRKDTTLNTVMNTMINMMMDGYKTASLSEDQKKKMTTKEIADWEKEHTKYLSDFGIGTLSYFEAADNEHHLYHIDGDKEDEVTAERDDKLRKAIAEDPDGTAEFFANLCKSMYDKLYDLMGSTDYSSIYKVYNDKQMKKEAEDYKTKISKAEKDLSDYEDKWYDKFTAMEKAMAKMQSSQNAVSSMLGG